MPDGPGGHDVVGPGLISALQERLPQVVIVCPVNVGGGRRSRCGGGVSGGSCRMGEGGSMVFTRPTCCCVSRVRPYSIQRKTWVSHVKNKQGNKIDMYIYIYKEIHSLRARNNVYKCQKHYFNRICNMFIVGVPRCKINSIAHICGLYNIAGES